MIHRGRPPRESVARAQSGAVPTSPDPAVLYPGVAACGSLVTALRAEAEACLGAVPVTSPDSATLLHYRLGLPQVTVAALFRVRPETINKRIRDIRCLLEQVNHTIQPAEQRLTTLDHLYALASTAGEPGTVHLAASPPRRLAASLPRRLGAAERCLVRAYARRRSESTWSVGDRRQRRRGPLALKPLGEYLAGHAAAARSAGQALSRRRTGGGCAAGAWEDTGLPRRSLLTLNR